MGPGLRHRLSVEKKAVQEVLVPFVWPAQRYDRLTRNATLLAAALTACAGLAIVLPAVGIYRAAGSASGPATDERGETVTFVQPIALRLLPGHRTSFGRSTATPASPARSPLRTDTSALTTNHVEASARVEPTTNPLSSDSKAVPRALGPYSASTAATLGRIDSGAAPPLPWRWLPPTQGQRDSAGRSEAQRATDARDDHRPLPIALGNIPIRMPFGGAVRSREERARDSVVNADYLRRLARLAERARAKRESTLATWSIARRDSAPTGTRKP